MYDLRKAEYLSSGMMKSAYRVAPDRVALVMGGIMGGKYDDGTEYTVKEAKEMLKSELVGLEKLEDLGFPVVKTYGIKTVIDELGRKTPAIIQEYIERSDPYTANLRDFDKIIKLVTKHKVNIDDFQWLVDQSGNVLIHDPRNVYVKCSKIVVDSMVKCISYERTMVQNKTLTAYYLEKSK